MSKLTKLIKNCNEVLATLDKIEDQRPLYTQERNFRNILKQHILTLLKYQNEYWRKRYTVRWVTLGDDDTKFFHAAATERYRINTITQIEGEDGRLVTDHTEKASILLQTYKQRIGKTDFPTMQFNLQQLIPRHDNLTSLSDNFTKEEIDAVVKQMPNDKSRGPDGFNGLFIKKCWHIIKDDFYQLCQQSCEGTLDLQSINNSFIVLIPKTNSPVTANDYRTISLLNSVLKLLTKLMANRLQRVIIPLIHKNQYGFIKTRAIQDCLARAYEYLNQCHQSKEEIIILKLDFEKAFDTVEYSAITQMMQQLGFTDKWITWVSSILKSATTSILLNGVPGNTIQCKRGVRQGDPLSPLLFVLATDLLQGIINKACHMGLLTPPLQNRNEQDYPIVQYVDDIILIMKASQREPFNLKGILQTFTMSTD